MILTDNYSNLFSSLTNGSLSKKNKITFKNSKKILNVLDILLQEGFIRNFEILNNEINIYLKYNKNKPIFSKIQKISKPGKRVYIKNKELYNPKFKGLFILSTPKGIMSIFNAKKHNIGGEIICKII